MSAKIVDRLTSRSTGQKEVLLGRGWQRTLKKKRRSGMIGGQIHRRNEALLDRKFALE
jgi:hypothetical protein